MIPRLQTLMTYKLQKITSSHVSEGSGFFGRSDDQGICNVHPLQELLPRAATKACQARLVPGCAKRAEPKTWDNLLGFSPQPGASLNRLKEALLGIDPIGVWLKQPLHP